MAAERRSNLPTVVVSPNLHSRYPVAFVIANTESSLYDQSYVIAKRNLTFNFNFKHQIFGPRVLLDATGKTILTFLQKKQTFGTKWVVFRGDSTNSKDIIFSTKRSTMTHPESLDVFMGNEEKDSSCDFKIKGNWFSQSCTIHARDSTIIARMKMGKRKKLSIGKEKFLVLIYPEVDQAFVIAFALIMKLSRDIDVRELYSRGMFKEFNTI